MTAVQPISENNSIRETRNDGPDWQQHTKIDESAKSQDFFQDNNSPGKKVYNNKN